MVSKNLHGRLLTKLISRRCYGWIAFFLLLLLGLSYQKTTQAIDRATIVPPGKMLEVNGITTHLYCSGSGSPTVVLQAGAVGFAQSWHWIQEEVASTTRVCSYDRPGLGWSEEMEGGHTGREIASHLHQLLQQANEPGPYIMVGHSMGGPLVQIFAGLYRQDVIAVALLDPSHRELIARHPREALPQLRAFTNFIRAASVLAYTGIIRAGDVLAHKAEGLPEEASRAARLFSSSPQHLMSSYSELTRWEVTMASAQEYMLLQDLPLLVISASRATSEMPERHLKLLHALHRDLATMSSNSRYLKVPGADHFTMLTHPLLAGVTANALQELVLSARNPGVASNNISR